MVHIGKSSPMIKPVVALGVLICLAALAAPAQPQRFDYYLLALSWTPSFCEAEGDAEDREQCEPGQDFGFTLHGLWPQYEDGWPEFCDSARRDPSRRQTGAMADIMGSGGLAWYQWKKHGRCTGLDAADYFDAAREAYKAIAIPPVSGGIELRASELEQAFLDANDDLDADTVIVTCRDDLVREVRICLNRDLAPRACAPDVERAACSYRGRLDLPPIR